MKMTHSFIFQFDRIITNTNHTYRKKANLIATMSSSDHILEILKKPTYSV